MKKTLIYITSIVMLITTIALTILFSIQTKKDKTDIAKYNLENPVLIQYTDFEQLKKAIDDDDTWFIYFGKPNCPYCKRYLPIVNEIMYNKNIPILYFNAESIKGSYYDEEGNLKLNEKYVDVINWIKDNSIVDAKENSWIGSKTENNQTVDWLMVPRFFKVENGKITNCFKAYDKAETLYKEYLETQNEQILNLFKKSVQDEYIKFMNNKATDIE